MSITIVTEEIEQRQLKVTAEVSEDQVQEAMRRTARRLAKQVSIPGFRQGKVPYPVLLRRLGEETLRAEAAETFAEPVLNDVLANVGDQLYDLPQIQSVDLKPMRFVLTAPLMPRVSLGDYRQIEHEVKPVQVMEESVAEALESIQYQHQVIEPVDRPAEPGDLVTVAGVGTLAGEEADKFFDEKRAGIVLDAQKVAYGPAFVEQLVGMSAGEEKQFEIQLPADYPQEEQAGKQVRFSLTVLDVNRREVPALDDELAQEEGDYETLAELRQAVEQDLRQHAEQHAREERLNLMIEHLLETAEIAYPPIALEKRLDELVQRAQDRLKLADWQWQSYLRLQGQTEEELRQEWREQAREQLERTLVLSRFVEEERLAVTPEEVDRVIEESVQILENEEVQQQSRDIMRSGQESKMIRGRLLMEKVHERIEAIFTGQAPELPALPADEEE